MPERFRQLTASTAATTAAVILGLAALGGLTLAGIRLSGAPQPPTWMAIGHGSAAAVGLLILIYGAMTTGLPGLGRVALGVLLVAALGGATIFLGYHLRDEALPIPLVLAHGITAATGLVLLLLGLFRGR
jgi:hypothetical protein